MTKNSRFQRGSGVFTCENCKRRTRATGHSNEHLGLCAECYELCGLENHIADNGETPELLAEVERLKALIRSKGGVLE